MFIKNISGETIPNVETGIDKYPVISMPPNAVQQVADATGLYYVNNMSKQFELTDPTAQDPNYLGYYATPALLIADHPTAIEDNFAMVGSTNSVRRRDGSAWVDTGTTVNIEPSQKLTVTANGQTIFNLTFPVNLPGASTRLYVNGQKADYGTQYTFTTDTELERQDVGYTLETTDILEFYYI